MKQEQVEYNKAATAPKIPVKLGYLFNGWDKNFDHVISEMVIRATYKEILFTPPSSTPSLPLPKEETPMKPTQDKPKTPADSESVKKYFNSVENKSTGTKIETINEDKIFESNVEVVIKDAKGKDKQKASQKIDNIIKVFDILLKQDGVRMEKKLDSKIRIYIDAKDYADYKDLKIYQKTSAGKYIELPMEVKNGKITFECDSLDTYVLSGTKETFPWWIPIGVLAVGGIVLFAYMKYKKSDK